MKTIERAHTPAKMWERVKLSNNYAKALEQIDSELIYWPKFITHKCKQRITKITQYLIKMRRLSMTQQPKMVGIKKKLDRREATRERKALQAAHLEKAIEKELLERLRSKAYGDAPLNVNEDVWQAVLDMDKQKLKGQNKEGEELELDMEDDESEEEDYDEEEMEEEYEGGEREFVEDSGSESEDMEDFEGFSDVEGVSLHTYPGNRDSDTNFPMAVQFDEADSDEEDEEGSDDESDEDEAPAPQGPSKKGPDAGVKRKGPSSQSGPKPKKAPRVDVEYEVETEPLSREMLANW